MLHGKLVHVIAVAALLAAGVQSWRLRATQQAAADHALRADSTAAAADSSRQLAARVLAAAVQTMGTAMAGVERRAIQQRQRADDLDRALGRERIALAAATVRIQGLEATLASVGGVREDSGVRVADFEVRQPPYTIEATASLPPAPRPASLRVGITLDTIPLQLRLGCGPADAGGIRPATTTILGPPWATLSLGRVEQDPSLCRSPALAKRGPSRVKWAAIGAGVAALVLEFLRRD